MTTEILGQIGEICVLTALILLIPLNVIGAVLVWQRAAREKKLYQIHRRLYGAASDDQKSKDR